MEWHSFNIKIATKYGMACAVIIANLDFWISKNKANNINYYDGKYWTYNSKKAFSELFPYLSERQIRTALDKLIEEEIIITGNYNKSAYDRTLWYAFTDKGEKLIRNVYNDNNISSYSIMPKSQMDNLNKSNGIDCEVQPIPYINTDIKQTDIIDKKNNISKDIFKKSSKFQKPTLDELKEYCSQMNYKVDAEKFFLYYEQCGWTVGKNKPMKDWRASLRLWNMNQSQYQERTREQSKVASLNFSNEECEKQLKDEVIPF